MHHPAEVKSPPIELIESGPGPEELLEEVQQGLAKAAKELPSKLFYDERGSELFDRISKLDEYYLTRAETAILEQNAGEIGARIGPRCLLIEYGSGSGLKTRMLLDALVDPVGYIPIDLSRQQLVDSATAIAEDYPQLAVIPILADYTRPVKMPELPAAAARRVGYFPGSTIGNLYPKQAVQFFRRVAGLVGSGGALLIGADLQKDPIQLHRAYNDRSGVTAEFNLNILSHLNQLFGSDFRLDRFAHEAHYNEAEGRIEMHLISREAQTARLDRGEVHFQKGERILTEVSYKYRLDQFSRLAHAGGFVGDRVWTDSEQLFSLHLLVAR